MAGNSILGNLGGGNSTGTAGGSSNPVSNLFDTLSKNSEKAEQEAKESAEHSKAVVNAIFDRVESWGSEIQLDAGIPGGAKASSQKENPSYDL